MTAGEDKSRDVDTAVEDLRRYKAHLSEIARYTLNIQARASCDRLGYPVSVT